MKEIPQQERADSKDLEFLDTIDENILDIQAGRILGGVASTRTDIGKVLEKERILDWKGKKEIIERFLKSFRYKGISLKDIEQSIEGKPKGEAKEEELNLFWQSLDTIIYDDIKKLTRGQLDFLLNEENTKILKLRVKNRQEGKIGAERKKIQKQIENLTHPETRESSPEYQKPYLNLIQDRLDEHVLSKKVEHIKQKIAKHIEILEAAA